MDLQGLEMIPSVRRGETVEERATPCRANDGSAAKTRCKYGRSRRPIYHELTLKRKSELGRTSERKYQDSFNKFHTLARSRGRAPWERKFKLRRCKMLSTNVIFFVFIYFLLVCEAKVSVKGTPPRLIGEPRKKMVATVGEPVILKCAVEAEPPPLTTWKANGKVIHGVRPRFKVGMNLRIRDVRSNDAGRYRCTATNAFGSVDYDINLVVRDQGEKVPTRPRFVMPAKMRKRSFSKPVNSFLRLRCRASGYPAPQIKWFKDGNLTVVPKSKSRRRPSWIYTFRKLERSDSGLYRCVVSNSEGTIEYTYKVNVIEQLRERPVLLAPHPMNTTVQVGGMTAIQCRVQSRVKPTVKWIKRLDDRAVDAYGGNLPPNVVTIEGHQYLILPTQEMLPMANGSYLNKLVIRGATEKHAGMYICLAANTMGYNFKYAYLTVISGRFRNVSRGGSAIRSGNSPRSISQNKQGSLSLPAIIGVPAGIGLVMVAFLAWFCHRRREEKLREETANVVVSSSDRLSALGSSETKSSTRSTPVLQDYEHHYAEENTNNKDSLSGTVPPQMNRNRDNYYSYTHRPPPTAGTPLLTVNEPDDSEYPVAISEDDMFCVPDAPPCSEAVSTCHSGTDERLSFSLGAPPPPPPSQKTASSLSSYTDTRQQYPHHYHYMHPPGNSRRHHHHHHSRNNYHHYGYR